MDTKRVVGGVLVWSLGLAVPLFYHAMLMNAAVREQGYSYSYHNMCKYFFSLPWIVWPYLVATGIVGACLVISGLRLESP